jgi:hypothetical protein
MFNRSSVNYNKHVARLILILSMSILLERLNHTFTTASAWGREHPKDATLTSPRVALIRRCQRFSLMLAAHGAQPSWDVLSL